MTHVIGHYEKVRAIAAGPRLLAVGGVRAPSPARAGSAVGAPDHLAAASAASPAGAASQVTLFDHVANKSLRAIDVPAHVAGLVFVGDLLAAACSDGTLRIFEPKGGAEVRVIEAHAGGVTAVAAAPARGLLATVGADGALRVFQVGAATTGKGGRAPAPELTSGAPAGTFPLSAAPLRAVAFDAAGEMVAAAGDDGVVRAVALASGARRDMPGHDGPVTALTFTLRDGRLASGGDDGTVRLWYLAGDIEAEVRGADGSGRSGAVHALLCLQLATPANEGDEPRERLLSAGADGRLLLVRLEDRRKPRTLETSALPLHAIAFVPAHDRGGSQAPGRRGGARAQTGKGDALGTVFAAGDRRTVWRFALDGTGAPDGSATALEDGFAALSEALSGARPAREAAVRTLASLDEPDAQDALLRVLREDRDADVRALAARELGARGRRGARAALREALDDEHAAVRSAAFASLCALDADAPLAPLRAGLNAGAADIRRRAVEGVAALHGRSPLVPGLIAERLADRDASVRLTALAELSKIDPGSHEPLRAAFDRGPADLRIEVLVQAALRGALSTPEIAPIAARALDDVDAEVRRAAFAAKVIERRALARALEAGDDDLARAIRDIARRAAESRARRDVGPPDGAGEPRRDAHAPAIQVTDEAVKEARAAIPSVGDPSAELGEPDLEPLIAAMACRTPDTAMRGARGLAQLGDTRALGALLQLTREADPSLRRRAVEALAALRDARAERRLVWMLDDADASVRAAALDALDALDHAAPLVIAEASLRSSHEDIRVRGLARLVKTGATAEAEALLADAIEDESPKVRGEAFRTLWSWHASDPAMALDRALAARFPDLRLRAVEELRVKVEQRWAAERLHAAIGDRDAAVALAAYDAVVKQRGAEAPEPHLAAMASIHAAVRARGAMGAALAASMEAVRSPLVQLLEDEHEAPRTAAVEALDKLFPNDPGPLHVALQSSHLDLRVRAAELCAARRDERLVSPMKALLADHQLLRWSPTHGSGAEGADRRPGAPNVDPVIGLLRVRAATALATVGAPRLVRYFGAELLKDEHGDVREQAARGLAMAARRGDEGYLLDAMGHADVAVRSWAADGLARLGDARALPVLTGTLRHEHPPIRVASIMSFAALGPEGYGGMLQGLEDPSREVQEIVFSIILARDLRAFRRGEPPELLTSALSSQRPDVRFAAARALELRTEPEPYLAHLIEALTPPAQSERDREEGAPSRSDKADKKGWPPEVARGRLLVGLAEALASDSSEQRYAAAQVLRLRRKPLEYFREAKRVAELRPAGAPIIADTTPRAAEDTDTAPAKGWLRRLFARDAEPSQASPEADAATKPGRPLGILRRLRPAPQREPDVRRAPSAGAAGGSADVPDAEQRRLRWLAFGAYMGLLRQSAPGDDGGIEAHRVRRDAIERIVDQCAKGHVSRPSALPPLVRALDDPHHLVRRAAFAGVKALFPAGAGEPLALGLSSASSDVARAALDELAARGEAARPGITRALSSPIPDVRRYAFELLERQSPEGSLDPLLAALGSDHADLRLGVIERLASSSDPRIVPALCRAMESDHDDLRLRAAELLARRRDDRAVDVLATFLRGDDVASAGRARGALVALASAAAVRALAARMDEALAPAERAALARALGGTRGDGAMAPLTLRFEDEAAEVRSAAFEAALEIVSAAPAARGPRDRRERDAARALPLLVAAARAKDPVLRLAAARELDVGGEPAQSDLLLALFSDRDLEVRVAAVTSYAKRVIDNGAPTAPLEAILGAGTRELLLPAAEGAAARGVRAALRPLLLVARAGEPGERERALLSLGVLGDARAEGELAEVAAGGTKEAPVSSSMQAAATEALGRLAGKLTDAELRRRVALRVEEALSADGVDLREAAARGVRWMGGERARVLLEDIVRAGGTPERLRVVAITELGLLGDTAAELMLVSALDAPSAEARRAARGALEKLFPGERTRVELHAVGSRYEDVAVPAASYLAAEAAPSELLPRLAVVGDERLRQRLVMGLQRRPALPALELARSLDDDAVPAGARRAAAWLIATLPPAEPGGSAALTEADRRALAGAVAVAVRRAAARWASARGADRDAEVLVLRDAVWAASRVAAAEAVPELRALLGGDASSAIRREAARALAAHGDSSPEVLATLTAALRDMSSEVRAAAAAALGALSPDAAAEAAAAARPFDPVAFDLIARSASTDVLATLATTEPGRRLAFPALIHRAAVDPLAELARGAADETTRLDAIAALGRLGGERAIDVLAALSFDKKGADLVVRKAAYRAYRRAKRRAAKPAAILASAASTQGART